MTSLFVWVQTPVGPQPQLWPEPKINSATGKPIPTLFQVQLSPSQSTLPISRLKELFPCPSSE